MIQKGGPFSWITFLSMFQSIKFLIKLFICIVSGAASTQLLIRVAAINLTEGRRGSAFLLPDIVD